MTNKIDEHSIEIKELEEKYKGLLREQEEKYKALLAENQDLKA